MPLRNQIPDNRAQFPDPILGVNLNDAVEDVVRGQALLMKNTIRDGGVVTRPGSQRLTGTQIAASLGVRGGHKFYYGSSFAKRLIAYGTKVSVISDVGVETELTSGMTNDQDTHFTTWSIQDKVYIANNTDELQEYDGTTFQSVSANASSANVPGNGGNAAAKQLVAISDRLLAITENGIERTDARVGHIWSNQSTWATFQPSSVGPFTAMIPHSLQSAQGDITEGVIAFQANAYYFIKGTDFGTDVTAGAPSSGENSSIDIIDPNVGTSSPYSVVSVPGVGIFFVTSDLNIFFIPFGRVRGEFVGDNIRSTRDVDGIESVNPLAVSQVWMSYFDRRLMVGLPLNNDLYASRQYWLDMRSFVKNQDLGPVWNGPMDGQTVSRVWVENQNGDNKLYGGEGNTGTGIFVYRLRVPRRFTDAVGTADTAVDFEYQTYLKTFGAPSRSKYIQSVELELNNYDGDATLDVRDLRSTVASNLPIHSVVEE